MAAAGRASPTLAWQIFRPRARRARDCRDARLHGAGAAGRPRRHDADRCVCARPRALRDVHRQAGAHHRRGRAGQPVVAPCRSRSGDRTRHPALPRARSGAPPAIGDRRRRRIAGRQPARGGAGGRRNTVARYRRRRWRSRHVLACDRRALFRRRARGFDPPRTDRARRQSDRVEPDRPEPAVPHRAGAYRVAEPGRGRAGRRRDDRIHQ